MNEEVLTRAGLQKKLLNDIKKRQLKFIGHVIWVDGVENVAMLRNIGGKDL